MSVLPAPSAHRDQDLQQPIYPNALSILALGFRTRNASNPKNISLNHVHQKKWVSVRNDRQAPDWQSIPRAYPFAKSLDQGRDPELLPMEKVPSIIQKAVDMKSRPHRRAQEPWTAGAPQHSLESLNQHPFNTALVSFGDVVLHPIFTE